MNIGVRRRTTSAARVRRRGTRAWRPVIGLAVAALAATGLAACGTAGASTGPVTLNFYFYPDTSGATQTASRTATQQSTASTRSPTRCCPQAADDQRQQLVRRLAAHDTTIDILGLDVTWEAEFAQAGWIQPWTGADKAQAENGTLKPALDTAIWKGQLYAVPDNSNTQLLWYRSDLVQDPAHDLGPDDRRRGAAGQGGQAALHRDPGRAVRGRHRLVQHDGGQRGRHAS